MALLRRVLLAIVDSPYPWDTTPLGAADQASVAWHTSLLIDAGLVAGIDDTARAQGAGQRFTNCRPTGRGADMASLLLPEERWQQVATTIGERVGDAPLDIWERLLREALERELDG